jgi:RHS repeat-associated protein
LTDQNGGVVWRVTYESFGKAFVNDDVDGDGTVVTFDVRYPGQWEDSESGLYYNLHRYYQPNLGGYYSRDPKEIIGLVASLGESFVSGDANLYRYVINSPLNFIDPEGAERKGGSKKGNNGVIGQPFNRPGPVDQSGRTGRTGNPISQPPGGAKVKNPNVPTAEKVKRRVMSKVIEKITSKVAKIDPKTGLITPNPVGVGIVLMSPASTAECQTLSCDLDGDGFADKEFNEGICKPGFN